MATFLEDFRSGDAVAVLVCVACVVFVAMVGGNLIIVPTALGVTLDGALDLNRTKIDFGSLNSSWVNGTELDYYGTHQVYGRVMEHMYDVQCLVDEGLFVHTAKVCVRREIFIYESILF